jgi:GntR family transcriptional regulator/GntR family frlABCD operon transcriptional regulator
MSIQRERNSEFPGPKYRQVQHELYCLIVNGIYKAGDALPSENDLSAQYGITRMTVRNALQSLENDGLIKKIRGKGSIVQSKRKSVELLSIRGFTEVMKSRNMEVETRIIKKPQLTAWPQEFFFQLSDLEKTAGCIKLERLRLANSELVMYEISYLPNFNLNAMIRSPLINGSLFDTLQINHKIEILGVRQKFRALKASGQQVELLEVEPGDPLLHITRKLNTNREHFNLYSSVYFNSENHLIEI